jgi:hypothetical protein
MEALKFSSADLRELAEHFEAISHKVPLRPINSDRDYDFAVRALARFKPTLHIPCRWIMGPHFLPCPTHDAIRPCCNDQTDC